MIAAHRLVPETPLGLPPSIKEDSRYLLTLSLSVDILPENAGVLKCIRELQSQDLSSLQLPRAPPSPGVQLAEEHLSNSNFYLKARTWHF